MSNVSMKIGVLDIQGSVEEHIKMLKKLGVRHIAVKTKQDLDKADGLIIPGGESTTIGKLMKKCGLDKEIRKRASLHSTLVRRSSKSVGGFHTPHSPLTIWGTCAGAILLAKKVYNRQPNTLGLMDIEIERNAYGRQIDSFETDIKISAAGSKRFRAIFIRAPRIKKGSSNITVLAKYQRQPIMVRQDNLLATMFHPELTSDPAVHRYFIRLTKEYATGKN